MTENEAIEYMKNEVECIKRASHCDRDCLNCELVKEEQPLLEAFDMAIQALEENQQYHAIGTVAELQALKEKAEPKKPISIDGWGEYWKCPTCGKYAVDNLGCKLKFCRECGTKFDWS